MGSNMALAENPSKVEIEEYCQAVLFNLRADAAGCDPAEWSRIDSTLYGESNVVTRFIFLLREHIGDFFFLTILLDLLGTLFSTSFLDIIQDIDTLTVDQILERIDTRVNKI